MMGGQDAQGMKVGSHYAVENNVYALTARAKLLHGALQFAPKLKHG
jgi:hypothetical protein